MCPVCALRGALEQGQETVELELDLTPSLTALRFDHYQVLTREDGTPFELGRGAMGVTYKAIDINLRCAVALKVIGGHLIGDESAHRRFVREARAAASVRHPNVASVFHLGKSGDGYFYAMEFVEGETLESLIKRCGCLEVKLALEIASQVAAGLAAVDKGKLVHRDIKSSNIMVSLDEGGVTVKIIDLGLAKSLDEQGSQTAISMPGGFAGTPAFASPEHFAGVGVDIRSDLYSLGVTLWEMLTGRPPFRGTAAELIYQHQHGFLPLERLKGVPQRLTAILETLLDKDPKRRFQTPAELLKTLSTVTSELGSPGSQKHEVPMPFVRKVSCRRTRSGRTRPQDRSVAVLPFESLSASKRDTYFGDGVQDEILSNLAKSSQLRVISRTSVMAFRAGDNRNLRSIAEALGVVNVVEGTVRRDGKHVRLTIRLVDARRDKTLWSETYDRDLTDIFATQSEIAQAVAFKLSAHLSPEEKKRIEAKPTKSLEAYDLYLRARELLLSTRVSFNLRSVEKVLVEALGFLEQAVRLDPKFTLAYCASARAYDNLYFLYNPTPEQRAFGDAAVNRALGLQPDLAEVHLAYAHHLYLVYRDYERANVQLAIARRGLPNDVEAIVLAARIDRRQGRFEKAISEFNEAITRDPCNAASIQELADTLYYTRQFRAAEQAFDRLTDLRPDMPILKARKPMFVTFYETGDATAVRSAIAALPPSIANDRGVLSLRLKFAFVDRDWPQAEELIEKMKGYEDEGWFAYGDCPVPAGCNAILLARLQSKQPGPKSNFADTRQQLTQKIQKSAGDVANACLLSDLAVVDALLEQKEAATAEAKRAVEMLPISKDVLAGLGIAMNLAVVYAWTGEVDSAFATLNPLAKTPFGIFYGQLKCDPYWDPLRKDPRFEKLLAQLAPNQSRQKAPSSASRLRTHKLSVRSAPKKISVARLPVTGSDLFGRDEDIAFLDRVWVNKDVNIVTIVAWAGVGKSTLINHWLRKMAADHYRSAELVFGWSFYRQGTSGGTSSADEFLDAALAWIGDPDPRHGTAWEKGERLAKLVAHRRTLLILDGLEPLQNPPGPQEGRIREPSLQALLRELAVFNKGLCVITTRLPVADIGEHERASALRLELEQLSSRAGAQLLLALGVKGDEEKLRNASDEFGGHCLALTLLGSYLTDAYSGDIRRREEVSARLAHDVRQGVHARKVMESYQTWFGEGPELSILRILGLFDRPADEKALRALLKPPAIQGLTEPLVGLNPAEWRAILRRLRGARLLAAEDPHNPGQLDTHPLVREYFGEQLQSQQTEAWKECNRRLYEYYRTLAPQLPDSFREMEPLFLAVMCACNVGLLHDALHEVYLPRIQRGNKSFAANVLGVRGALLSSLAPFFEQGRWGSPRQTEVEGQSLNGEDQLYILTQAGLYLTSTRSLASAEARICYEHAESLCHSLNRPLLLYATLISQWRHSVVTDKLTAAMQIANRVHSLAKKQNDAALMIGAYAALANTLCYLGDFENSRQYAMHGLVIWRSGGVKFPVEEIIGPPVSCLIYKGLSEWFLGEIASSQATRREAISLAKELNDMSALALSLYFATSLLSLNAILPMWSALHRH